MEDTASTIRSNGKRDRTRASMTEILRSPSATCSEAVTAAHSRVAIPAALDFRSLRRADQHAWNDGHDSQHRIEVNSRRSAFRHGWESPISRSTLVALLAHVCGLVLVLDAPDSHRVDQESGSRAREEFSTAGLRPTLEQAIWPY